MVALKSKIAIKQSTISSLILGIFFLIAVLLIGSIVYMRSSIQSEQAAEQRRTEFKQLGISLADASDFLTDEARKYAITTDIAHLQRYWEEINNTQTRDKVILKLKELDSPDEELELLAKAKQHSDALVDTERRSMRLVLEALKVPEAKMVPEVASYVLKEEDRRLGSSEKLDKAREIMFDSKYDSDKKEIMDPIAKFQEVMNARLENELETARNATAKAAVVQTVLALIIIFSIALLISTLFKYVTYPINSYTKLLRKLTFEDDKFNLLPEGTLELQQLANNFNELYFSFHDELQKRRKAEKTMRAAKEEAELANNAKSEFLASMSHEIRTPLNTIIGYQFLLNDTALEVRQKEYCDKIGMVTNNLLGLINGILDFSKIETGKMQLESVEFDCERAIQDIYTMVSVNAVRKGLELSLVINNSFHKLLLGDVTRLKQVVLNLLSNAVKFTERGSITISLDYSNIDENSVDVIIGVKDTGIGISQEQQKMIFDRFTQADASTTRKYGGTGLGLAISKSIAELMNGSITVESENGKGACFIFTAKFVIGEEKSALQGEKDTSCFYKAFINKKILLVEDNEINLQMTGEILELMGFQTYTANSGRSAIELVNENQFDVILMDIRMPDMDGYETTKEIRTLEMGRDTIVIALTADAVEGVEEKAKSVGMNGFLAKPLYPDKLFQMINKFLNKDEGETKLTELKNSCNWSGLELDGCNQNEDRIFKDGVVRLGGNHRKYIEILRKFIEEHKADGEELQLLYDGNSLKDFGNLVHKLKGITGNLGANNLFILCKNLEEYISNGRSEDQIRQSINAIKEGLEKLCMAAVNYINTQSYAYETSPVEVNGNFSEIVEILINLVSIADYDAKDYFFDNSQIIKRNLDESTYLKLKQAIMKFDFEQAENDLKSLTQAIS